MIEPVGLRCEYLVDPLGIDARAPRLSWRTETDERDWVQTAYEVEARDPDTGGVLWASGRIASSESTFVPWGGAPLASRQRCRWRVRVWGPNPSREPTSWSRDATFEVGLTHPDDWSARFITPAVDDGGTEGTRPSPYFRREFSIDGDFERARLYMTSLGVYEVELNGRTVGDQVLAPGWSSYDHRLRYQTHDVTELLQQGGNAIGVVLADGWARGNLIATRARYTDRLAVLAQLEITYADGGRHTVLTDPTWRTTATGPLRAADLYNGEEFDARCELDGWSEVGFDESDWSPTGVLDRDLSSLCAPPGPPIRRIETIAPDSITTALSGETIVDFGQNLVGRVRMRVRGPAGTTVTLRHAEVLEDGELCVRLLRGAQATDRYTLRGDPTTETWEPRFTFHGFRYVGITGWPGRIDADAIEAVVVHSDMERTGWFECSNELINRLHDNIVWGMRGNFVDVPTDCPQRDERLGWTGDLQVFASTAALLYDVSGVLSNWLADLAAEQTDTGVVPHVVPSVEAGMVTPTCGWGDAATVVPTVLHCHYADADLLERQLDSMRRWVDCEARAAGDDRIWSGDFQFGDWLDPAAPPHDPFGARADPDLLATAFLAHSARLVARAAAAIGNDVLAAEYDALTTEVAQAFRDEFVTARGRVIRECQTSYAIALAFDLFTPAQRAGAADALAHAVRKDHNKLGTGFLGTPWLCPALAANGRVDLAYRLLLNEDCPSWLYPVTQGATTIWERWDAIRPDGSINPGGEMLSFNHYAFGAIGSWLYHRVAGLEPDDRAPGWRHFIVAPLPGGDLTRASARVETPLGLAQVRWTVENRTFELRVRVRPNAHATVILPGTTDPSHEIGSGEHSWRYEIADSTWAEWMPGHVPSRYGPHTTIDEVAGEPTVMDVIVSVGTKILTIGSREEIGTCTVQECIDRAGLDDEEAARLLAAVTAL